MMPINLVYSMPATTLGSVNTSDAVAHGTPHAHLYACTHIAASLSSSLSVHGTSAAEYLNAPTPMLPESHLIALVLLPEIGQKVTDRPQTRLG
jgi:hypothetical protein